MTNLGDFALGVTFDHKFTTVQSTGAPATLAGTPVVSIYVGNGTTEITAGITLTVDFDSRTGLNNVRVVATSGNGFATATDCQIVITTGTVNSVSVVGYVVAEFSIENRSSLRPTVAARTLDVSATGEAGVDWANVGSPTTTVGLSGTTVKTATDVETDTADIQGRIPAALVSGRIDASVGAMAANVVTATAIASDAITDAKVASDVTIASVTGAVGSVTGAVGSVTGNVGGNVTGSVGSVVGAVGSVTGNVGGNVTGSVGSVVGAVGSVTGAVGSVTGNVGGNVVGTIGSLAAQAKADVNAEVLDVLSTDTFAEPSSVPAATSSLKDKIGYLFTKARNKITQTATTQLLRNDADSATIATTTVSDDGTTFTKSEDV